MLKRAPLYSIWIRALAAAEASAQAPAPGMPDAGTKASGEANLLDTLVVTARRRDELLQDVPISVTALSGAELESRGAEDLSVLGAAVPNMTIYPTRAFTGTVTAYIRGVVQFDPVWGVEPGVAVYVDDMYLARPQGALLELSPMPGFMQRTGKGIRLDTLCQIFFAAASCAVAGKYC